MKNLSKNEKILLVIMAITLTLFVYYRFFLNGVLDVIQQNKDKILMLTADANAVNITKLSNKTLTKELEALKQKYSEASKMLPKNDRNPEIAYDLKSMADKNKITIDDLSLAQGEEYKENSQNQGENKGQENTDAEKKAKPKESGRLMLYPVIIHVSGDYNSIMNYVKDIEQHKRIAEVTGLDMNETSKGDQGKVLQALIKVNYYFVEEIPTPKPEYEFNKGSYGIDNLFN